MNKDVILRDFLKLKEEGLIKENFSTYEELLDVLSEMFSNCQEDSTDAQEACNDLNDYLEGVLYKHCAIYTLGEEDWIIDYSDEFKEKSVKDIIKEWNSFYEENLSDIDDVCDSITHKVMDTMSNAGCDVLNALKSVCDEVFGDEYPFYVDMGELNPRISFLKI